jgi:o-succinylbenzoate synthase
MSVFRQYPFSVGLRVPVGGVISRSGWLFEGSEGWGEWSPLPSWPEEERAAAKRSAEEAATIAFPAPVRNHVEVCALVPRVSPAQTRELAVSSGCHTIKIKVGDPESAARVAAVREALPKAKIRLDANGSWDFEEALTQLSALSRFDLEYVEDPVASMEDLAKLRRRSPVSIAAEACVRNVQDAKRLRRLEAADVLVIKPQRIGGIKASLAVAEEAGIPTVPSSALETSVGLAAVLAVAAALDDLPFAAGVGTALLLEEDVVADPLIPQDGALVARRPVVEVALLGEGGFGGSSRSPRRAAKPARGGDPPEIKAAKGA